MGLIIPGEPPRNSYLLDADGEIIASTERFRVMKARVIPLDAEGKPTGPGHDFPVREATITRRHGARR